MKIIPIPCLADNYAYLVICRETKEAAIVDASEAGPVLAGVEAARAGSVRDVSAAGREGARPIAIWSTHHHWDHVGGNEEVAKALAIERVLGHASDDGRLPGLTDKLADGDTFKLGTLEVEVRHIPAHTLGAVAYIVRRPGGGEAAVFTGDTMFVAGCGRIFEGDPAMMHASLSKLASLDPATKVYCGHEYTEANLRFAAHVEPSNANVRALAAKARTTREAGQPTVPSTIADELACNPFLRVDSPEIRATLGIPAGASDADALGAIREAKNTFR
ncbi:MAG: hydroxyacylglutathione hydrolase [Myxococcales bacterium]|nr:hydroxyacylglutathione hydrolase [Myxococcales bacterium]